MTRTRIRIRSFLAGLAALAVLAVLAGCPTPPGGVTPTLPGDGTAHVAKPNDTTSAANDPWTGRTDLITAPAAQPPAKLALPPVTRFTLPNGLTVMVVPDDRLPLVSMQMAIRAGRGDEPRALLGVAEFTANMLVKGTKKRDALGIAKMIDFVGGTLAASASFEATILSCNVLSKDLSTCLTVLPEMVASPSFPEDEVKLMRQIMVAGVRQRLDDAGKLAAAHTQNLLWGDEHVRGWVVDEEALTAIQRADLVSWHKQWFSPSNALLVVAGAVDAKKLQGQLTKAFAAWKKTATPPHPSFKAPSLSGTKIRLVDKPGQTQSHIRIGQYGIRHDDARYFDSLVWNYALGGGEFGSRLMKVVRVAGGKSYGASSTFDRNMDRGSFVAATFTRNAEAVATTKLLQGEIKKMAKDGPTEAEVADAVSNIAGSYALKFQSANDVAGALLAAELHGFGDEYLANYALAVGKVDVASAKAAANEILDPNNYVIVIVGDARDVEPQLKSAGWRYAKVAFTDPIGKRVDAGGGPATTAAADPAAVAAATKLLDGALATKGGEKKLRGLKSMLLSVKGTTSMQGQTLPIEMTRTLVNPDKTRVDIVLADGAATFSVGIDGGVGWQRGPDDQGTVQTVDIPQSELGAVEADRWRDPETVLLRHKEKGTQVTPLADQKLDGKDHAVVRITKADGSLSVDLYIDKKTKLVSRMEYKDQGASLVDEFTDYKDVQGIKVAHKRASSGGARASSYEITKVEFDGTVDPAIFAKPTEK
jgi:zinc protease